MQSAPLHAPTPAMRAAAAALKLPKGLTAWERRAMREGEMLRAYWQNQSERRSK